MAVVSGPTDQKICLLNVLEHSSGKTDLQILGNICTTSEYFLLVSFRMTNVFVTIRRLIQKILL